MCLQQAENFLHRDHVRKGDVGHSGGEECSGGVEQSVPHTLFRNEILAQRKREAHAGEFSHEEIGKIYHLMPKMFLCAKYRGSTTIRANASKTEIVFLEGGNKCSRERILLNLLETLMEMFSVVVIWKPLSA